MSKQSFIKGTMILLAAGIINRILGFVPRITLPRVIGPEGIGLYQMGYPFLIVVLTLITGGIPIAVSKLVAEAEAERNEKRVGTILKLSLGLTIALSIFFTAVCVIAAPWITANLFTDSRVYYTFLCMSPIILMAAVSAVYRGYFQGRHNMIPTALSGIVETTVRIFMMLAFSYFMIPYGIEYAAAGAMTGVAVGELSGMLVLYFYYGINNRQQPDRAIAHIGTGQNPRRLSTLKKLLKISIPVTGGKLVGSASYFLESILIVHSLAAAGVATKLATAQYGSLQGMILPIVLLPSALTYSLAVSLVPFLSEAAAKKDMPSIHNRLHQSLKLSLVTGAPFVVMMYILADPLVEVLYNQQSIGLMLRMLAPIALFIYFQAPLQATLQALDRPVNALVNTFAGSAVKLGLIVWLVSKPEFGIFGAVIAMNVNIAVVTILHWISVTKLLNFTMDMTSFLKVGAAMLVSGCCCYLVMHWEWTDLYSARFLASVAACFIVYLFAILLLKLVDPADFRRLHLFLSKNKRPR